MVGVCCGCVAQPASTKPRKTYNILVPQLFAGDPIKIDEPLDSSLRRKIQKLQEYVQKNPAKIPKVSRRLMRKVRATLMKPGDNLGYVKVAVHTYAYLLAKSADEVSSYSFSFFASELVSGNDALIPTLLRDGHISVRTLGAELLAVFIKVQTSVDNKLDAVQVVTQLVCKAARGAIAADRAEQKLQETAERRRAGDKLAMPNPLNLMARQDPARVAGLEAACLRSLCGLIELCQKAKAVPEHLEQIEAVVLDNLNQQQPQPSADGEARDTARDPFGGVIDIGFYDTMGISNVGPTSARPQELAEQLLHMLGGFTRDIATVHKLMGTFYVYMDEREKWQEKGMLQNVMNMLRSSRTQHAFPIYTSMLRHASSKALSPSDCAVVVNLAAELGRELDHGYSLAALAVALQELPHAWAEQVKKAPGRFNMQAFLDLFRPRGKDHDMASSPPQTSSSQQQSPEAAEGQRQLSALKDVILAASAELAARVSTASELADAMTTTFRTAAQSSKVEGDVAGVSAQGAMALECAAAAAQAAALHFTAPDQLVLPACALPPALVSAALLVLQSWPAVLQQAVLRALYYLRPAAVEGIHDQKHAASLASVCCKELTRLCGADSAGCECSQQLLQVVDGVMRLCMRGAPKPAVILVVARLLLQLKQQWSESGYVTGGPGNATKAHSLILMVNSWLAVLADATSAPQLMQYLLPVVGSTPALRLSAKGVEALSDCFITDHEQLSADALAQLQQQVPSSQWGEGLEMALSQIPILAAQYGESLHQLLSEQLASKRSTNAGDVGTAAGKADKQMFSEKVNAILLKRMSTLRKDFVHVSELMRDSIAPRQSLPGGADSATPPAVAITSSARTSSEPGAATAAAASASGATPTGTPTKGSGLLSGTPSGGRRFGADGVGRKSSGGAGASTAGVVTPESVRLLLGDEQGVAAAGKGALVSLEDALQLSQAAPEPSCYVVGDVQISHLAGQIEPVLR